MAEQVTSGDDERDAGTEVPPEPTVPVAPPEPAGPHPASTLPVPVAKPSSRARIGAILPAALLVVAVWIPLQLWGLSRPPFHTKGEPREALVVQSIVRDNEWVLPRRNAVELPSKPPLFHWLGALAARARGGVDEAAVRLPSALSSLGAALIVLVTGTVAWSVVAGLTAALTLLTSFEWLRAATSARVDMTLSFGLTAALCGLLLLHLGGGRIAHAALGFGSAWAVLSKGPVGLALPLLLAAVVTLAERSLRLVRAMRLLRVLLVVVVIAGAWYALAILTGGSAFVRKQVLTENVWRFVGTSRFTEGHRHGVLYLFGVLLAGLLPWTLLVPSIAAALWRTRRMLSRHDAQTFLLLWVLVVFAFYSIASSKRGVYLLALYPALFLLLGWWVHTARQSVIGFRALGRVLPPLAWVFAWLCGAFALLAALTHAGLPLATTLPDLLGARAGRDVRPVVHAFSVNALTAVLLFGGAAAAAAGAALMAARQRWSPVLVCLVVASTAISVAVRSIVMPAIGETTTRRNFSDALRRVVGANGDVAAYRSFDYGLVFYWGQNMRVYDQPLSASGPLTLVAGDAQWARATPTERRFYQRVPFIESPRGGNIGRLVVLQRRSAVTMGEAK
jgi:4-amino-4-deoxy-L-arabinose transferase-like glycosyltransferase